MSHPKSHRRSRLAVSFLILGVLLLLSTFADAQSLGDVATNATSSANKIGIAIQAGGRLLGLILIFGGLFMHYKAHKEKGQGQATHSIAIVSWMVGAAFFYAASVVHTTGNTLWGNGGGDQSTIQIPTN